MKMRATREVTASLHRKSRSSVERVKCEKKVKMAEEKSLE